MAEAVALAAGPVAQEVVEEATSVMGHIINIIRQALLFVYDQVKGMLRYIAENPLAFITLCVNMAIIFGP